MQQALLGFASVLLAIMAVGLVRALRGPTPGDRMMAVQLLGTASTGVLLLLAAALRMPALGDVALLFGLLGVVAVAALTRRRARTRATAMPSPEAVMQAASSAPETPDTPDTDAQRSPPS